jgi:hypothetical protein
MTHTDAVMLIEAINRMEWILAWFSLSMATMGVAVVFTLLSLRNNKT